MKISHLIIISVIAGLVIVIFHKNSVITNLNKEISGKNDLLSLMEKNIKTATKLQSIPVWYVVGNGEVSSSPDRKGELVCLDTPMLPYRSRLGIKHPETNKKVRFFPIESSGQAYTVAGGWLTYQYLD